MRIRRSGARSSMSAVLVLVGALLAPATLASAQTTPEADLALDKTGPGSIVAGTAFDYVLAVSNEGPDDNTGGFVVTDVLPDALDFVSADPSGACDSAESEGVETVTCTDADGLTNGGTATFTVNVTSDPATVPGEDALENEATVSPASEATPDNDATNDTDSVVSDVTAQADLTVTLTTSSTPRVAGALAGFDYTLTVDNTGPSDNTGGYDASFTLPSGFAFSSDSSSLGCSEAEQVVTCTNGIGLAAGDDDAYTVHAVIAASVPADTYGTQATVASNGTDDPVPGNDTSATADVNVITRADLSISKSAAAQVAPDLAYANANPLQNRVTFTITVSNADPSSAGPSDAQDVTVTDQLPAGTTFVSASAGCSELSGTVTCSTAGPLTPGDSRTYTVVVSVDDTLRGGESNNFTDTAGATSTTPDIDGDPYPTTATSDTTRVHTVPDAPTDAHTDSGNTNAVVSWSPTPNGPSTNGGEPITGYEVTLEPQTSQPGTCPNPLTLTTVTQTVPGATADKVDTGTNSLRNGCVYDVTVQARNAVGLSDPATSDTTATPSFDKSAEILGNGNNIQFTGNGTVGNNDNVVAKQSGTFGSGTIGSLEEITGGSSAALRNSSIASVASTPATFCGGLPCAADTIVLNKLTDPTTGRYIIELQYAKQVPIGTGKKEVYFDDTPDTAGDAVLVAMCPKKGAPGPTIKVCIRKLVANTSQNPAVLIQLSVRSDVIDPVSGVRR